MYCMMLYVCMCMHDMHACVYVHACVHVFCLCLACQVSVTVIERMTVCSCTWRVSFEPGLKLSLERARLKR
jgi:hypothetical protein